MQTQKDLRTILLLRYHDKISGILGEADTAEPGRRGVEPTIPIHQTGQAVSATACGSEWRRGGTSPRTSTFSFFNPLHSRRQDVFRRTLGAGNGVVRRNPRNPHYDTEMQIKILVECWRAGEGLGQEFVKHSMREHTSRRVGSHRKDSPPVPAEVLAHR